MKYKAVVFDYDQTIARTKKLVIGLHKLVAKKYYDLDIPDEEISSYWGLPFPEFLVKATRNVDTFENLSKKYYAERQNVTILYFDNAAQTINYLLTLVRVGILTSSNRDLILPDLESSEISIDKLFTIQTSDNTEFHKPDPRVFEPIIRNLDGEISKNEIVYVGDSLDDFHSSVKAGLDFVAILHDNGKEEDFAELNVNSVKDFDELKVFLLNS